MAPLWGRNLTLPETILPVQDYKYSLVWPGSRVLTGELGCSSDSEELGYTFCEVIHLLKKA